MTDANPKTDAPEAPERSPEEARKTRERKLAFQIGGGVFLVLLIMELLLVARAVSPLLVAFTLAFAAIVAFVIWLVRDTLHDKKRREAADADAPSDTEGT
ncbi:MAG: hypothetical protein AAF192_08475 [Pseudomonadota bacterium]